MKPFLEAINETPMVFDGAMGTTLYARGVFINVCFEELCLSRPDLIVEVHRAYVEAGADVIETNTFAANAIKLGEHGIGDKVAEINRHAVTLARQAAGDDCYVAGSVGPCLGPHQLWPEANRGVLHEAFDEQISALVEAGVDVLFLETFTHLEELQLAAAAAAGRGIPVFASFSVTDDGMTAVGTPLDRMVRALEADDNVDGIGLNCGIGPSSAFEMVEQALPLTQKPFVAMPNAGMPREVDGRTMYLTSPEYFTEYAKRLIEQGVAGVGGCCGTTPGHISQAAKAVKSLSRVKKHLEIRAVEAEAVEVEVVPQAEKSRFAKKMAAGEKVTSVELLPPRTFDLSGLLQKARNCHEAGVDAINIPDGPRASARVSPMIAAEAIEREVGIETVLHYCCRDRNLIGMQSDMLGGYAAGLRNILIITGDPPKLGDYPDATGVFDVDSIGLTQVVSNLNHGHDVGGKPIDPPTGIFIGVGANPVAISPEYEMDRYKQKIDAGAEFAITQPVFDVEALFRFMDEADTHTSTIPVIAGVWPLVSFKNAEFMRNEVPGVEVPDAVMDRMSTCKTKEDGLAMGIEIARDICAQIATRVAGFQVSAPFGRESIALQVLA